MPYQEDDGALEKIQVEINLETKDGISSRQRTPQHAPALSHDVDVSSMAALSPSLSRAPLIPLAYKRSEPQMRLKPLLIPTLNQPNLDLTTYPRVTTSSTAISYGVPSVSVTPPEPKPVPHLFPSPAESDSIATPLSESPVTPSSSGYSSVIAGVVDLTRLVRTVSEFPVAQGGLSDIYQGEWHKQSEDEPWNVEVVKVAIKVLRILTMRDPDGIRMRKRLNREVYVWHRLEHPNVVKLFGTSYHMAGRPAMIMQWYRNGSAADYLARKNPGADRLQLILDVARGLSYLHTHQPPIVHADLKGNNVLITDEGRAVLCDFGLSEVIEDLGRPEGMTLSNPDFGPLRWQAPEFMNDDDEPAMPASDVWSYGCTAFELLTGRIPYGHRTRDAQVIKDMQLKRKPPGPVDVCLLAFDARVRSLLDWCWNFEPDQRPKMTEVVAVLEEICGGRS